MAGESPDRSKQRESSAEPTSGSAIPVPESRPEPDDPTPARPDPRLAVARESAAADPADAQRGGVDTATRVLSRQELDAVRAKTEKTGVEENAEGSEDAGDVEAGAEEAEDAGDVEAGAEDGADAEAKDTDAEGKGDDRLRAAVAAWVTSEDPEDAKSTPDADEDADGEGEEADSSDKPSAASDADDDAPAAADGEDAPQGPPAPEDETRTGGAGGDTKAEGEAEASDDEAPAAADGEDAPQGPPAPEDETRTGGAGGDTEDEGEAEDAGDETPAPAPPAKAKPVDQPTAVFKAVRPTEPRVDQPTTMLKAPKPDAETPSERTSKFVALKPDIKPDTPKPPAPDVTAAVPQVGPERTTQQPLPPRPPLDLLAELTNTPPPPDTPVRTAIRRVKIWTPLVLLLVIVFAVVQSMRPLPAPTLDLTAEDTYTFDGAKVDIPWPADGQAALDVDGIGTFGSSGDQKPVPIASVAKVMTAYVILRQHRLDSGAEGPDITIDQAAEEQSDAGQESTVNVTKGDKISQREALESILIASANNVARLLARWDAGSEKAFVAKMNATAEDLGMTNTTYTDPSGLNNTTVSTAVDQVKLAKAAMKEPAFREVAAMMSYDDYKGHNHGNWNQLVGRNNVVGIKTGTTTSALGNLVFAAKKEIGGETRTVVGAVVRQPDAGGGILAAALDSGDKLIRAAQDALESATILKKGDVVGYVDDGLGGRTPVVATKDVKAVGWSGLKVELTFAAGEVPHTAKAGTEVGTLTVGDGSSGAVKIPVALQSDLAEPGFTDKLTRLG
ncbi:serine hydrolase [Streptomyces caeruleatus]|uniref:serine-type D-Ala-D-Ala carboxypeptidase n=1 Tax=Streptomyces caeruleatus TaxID=661399 RepID=A0A124I7X7_9ACTN|nr:serine hydrolase [Streptomyces caeruleatus]KUN97651.1 D-alanyl-D-alanine carboxypeptidase [Streptomyces caeruleatus]